MKNVYEYRFLEASEYREEPKLVCSECTVLKETEKTVTIEGTWLGKSRKNKSDFGLIDTYGYLFLEKKDDECAIKIFLKKYSSVAEGLRKRLNLYEQSTQWLKEELEYAEEQEGDVFE